jgi:hypothetical protein
MTILSPGFALVYSVKVSVTANGWAGLRMLSDFSRKKTKSSLFYAHALFVNVYLERLMQ